MNEEIKKNEISEEQLESVSGGIESDVKVGKTMILIGVDNDPYASDDGPSSPVYFDPKTAMNNGNGKG